MRILITRTDRIGDVTLSTPVIKALREKYPDSYIAFLVQPNAAGIVNSNPHINEVLIYDKKGREKNFVGMLQFARRLRKMNFDLAVILHPTNRMNLTCYLAGIPRRVGYDRKLGFLLTDKLRHTKHEGKKHEVEYTLDVIRKLGIEPASADLYICVDKKTDEQARRFLNNNGIRDGEAAVALCPGASCDSKKWPARNYAKVADTLIKELGLKVIIIGDGSDRKVAGKVISFAMEKPVDLAGKTSVGLLAGILKKCRLLISNDSGPVHIASSVGTPVIAIFGRSDKGLSPDRWAPRGLRDIILHKNVGCDKCLAHNCDKGYKCLTSVTVDEVINASRKILNAGAVEK